MKKFLYGLYDFANSSYTAVIITFVISTYFAKQIVGDVQLGAAYWQWTAGICGILIALTGPFLGNLADKKKNGQIYYLQIFTYLCIFITCLFWFSKPNSNFILYTLIIFLLSNFCYEISLIFYNSLLKKISSEKDIGTTSGIGFGLGYLGTVPILLLVLYVFILPEKAPLGLDKSNFENVRFVSFVVAAWFLFFALPMIIYFKKKIFIQANEDQSSTLKKMKEILWDQKLTVVGKFLIARMIYADALIVLISGGGVYAMGVFGYTFEEIIKLAISANIVALFGVLIGGYLNDKFSSKSIILVCIISLIGSVIYTSLIAQTKLQFFVSVMVVSIFLGTIQSASRVMMSNLLKDNNLGKGFGLFAFSGRITSFIGPLLVGTMTFFFSQRIGLLSCSLLFIIGFVLMLKVEDVKNN
jgi:UMF1 family MFS transporter